MADFVLMPPALANAVAGAGIDISSRLHATHTRGHSRAASPGSPARPGASTTARHSLSPKPRRTVGGPAGVVCSPPDVTLYSIRPAVCTCGASPCSCDAASARIRTRVVITNTHSYTQRLRVTLARDEDPLGAWSLEDDGENAGPLAPGASQSVDVLCAARDWRPIRGRLCVTGEHAATSIPVRATPAPRCVIAPTLCDLGSVPLLSPVTRRVTLRNPAYVPITVRVRVLTVCDGFNVEPAHLPLPPRGEGDVVFTYTPSTMTTMSVDMMLTGEADADGAGEALVLTAVKLTVTASTQPGAHIDATAAALGATRDGTSRKSTLGWARRDPGLVILDEKLHAFQVAQERRLHAALQRRAGAVAAGTQSAQSLSAASVGSPRGRAAAASSSSLSSAHIGGPPDASLTTTRVKETALDAALRTRATGVRLPPQAHLHTVAGVNDVITQRPGRLKPRDLALAIAHKRAQEVETAIAEAKQSAAEAGGSDADEDPEPADAGPALTVASMCACEIASSWVSPALRVRAGPGAGGEILPPDASTFAHLITALRVTPDGEALNTGTLLDDLINTASANLCVRVLAHDAAIAGGAPLPHASAPALPGAAPPGTSNASVPTSLQASTRRLSLIAGGQPLVTTAGKARAGGVEGGDDDAWAPRAPVDPRTLREMVFRNRLGAMFTAERTREFKAREWRGLDRMTADDIQAVQTVRAQLREIETLVRQRLDRARRVTAAVPVATSYAASEGDVHTPVLTAHPVVRAAYTPVPAALLRVPEGVSCGTELVGRPTFDLSRSDALRGMSNTLTRFKAAVTTFTLRARMDARLRVLREMVRNVVGLDTSAPLPPHMLSITPGSGASSPMLVQSRPSSRGSLGGGGGGAPSPSRRRTSSAGSVASRADTLLRSTSRMQDPDTRRAASESPSLVRPASRDRSRPGSAKAASVTHSQSQAPHGMGDRGSVAGKSLFSHGGASVTGNDALSLARRALSDAVVKANKGTSKRAASPARGVPRDVRTAAAATVSWLLTPPVFTSLGADGVHDAEDVEADAGALAPMALREGESLADAVRAWFPPTRLRRVTHAAARDAAQALPLPQSTRSDVHSAGASTSGAVARRRRGAVMWETSSALPVRVPTHFNECAPFAVDAETAESLHTLVNDMGYTPLPVPLVPLLYQEVHASKPLREGRIALSAASGVTAPAYASARMQQDVEAALEACLRVRTPAHLSLGTVGSWQRAVAAIAPSAMRGWACIGMPSTHPYTRAAGAANSGSVHMVMCSALYGPLSRMTGMTETSPAYLLSPTSAMMDVVSCVPAAMPRSLVPSTRVSTLRRAAAAARMTMAQRAGAPPAASGRPPSRGESASVHSRARRAGSAGASGVFSHPRTAVASALASNGAAIARGGVESLADVYDAPDTVRFATEDVDAPLDANGSCVTLAMTYGSAGAGVASLRCIGSSHLGPFNTPLRDAAAASGPTSTGSAATLATASTSSMPAVAPNAAALGSGSGGSTSRPTSPTLRGALPPVTPALGIEELFTTATLSTLPLAARGPHTLADDHVHSESRPFLDMARACLREMTPSDALMGSMGGGARVSGLAARLATDVTPFASRVYAYAGDAAPASVAEGEAAPIARAAVGTGWYPTWRFGGGSAALACALDSIFTDASAAAAPAGREHVPRMLTSMAADDVLSDDSESEPEDDSPHSSVHTHPHSLAHMPLSAAADVFRPWRRRGGAAAAADDALPPYVSRVADSSVRVARTQRSIARLAAEWLPGRIIGRDALAAHEQVRTRMQRQRLLRRGRAADSLGGEAALSAARRSSSAGAAHLSSDSSAAGITMSAWKLPGMASGASMGGVDAPLLGLLQPRVLSEDAASVAAPRMLRMTPHEAP